MKILMISGRSFGDAIITAFFLKMLERYCSDVSVDIITKKEYKFFFKDISIVDSMAFLTFPYMQIKRNLKKSIIRMAKDDYLAVRKYRKYKKHYNIALDFLGDFRERMLLNFFSIDTIYSIEREKGNLFNNLIHKGGWGIKKIKIKKSVINFYEHMAMLNKYVFGYDLYKREMNYTPIRKIGIHPFASQKSKLWSYKKWNDLIALLLKDGYEIVVFCAMPEKSTVINEFDFWDNMRLVCGDLQNFLENLKDIDLLIGLDSFSIHAANYLNVPSISLVGSQDGDLWKSPTTTIIQGGTSCRCWPCYNKPKKCAYECIDSITVDKVYEVICNAKRYTLV